MKKLFLVLVCIGGYTYSSIKIGNLPTSDKYRIINNMPGTVVEYKGQWYTYTGSELVPAASPAPSRGPAPAPASSGVSVMVPANVVDEISNNPGGVARAIQNALPAASASAASSTATWLNG